MSSRMEKYELEETKLASRAARNADLYQGENIDDYNKIDLNSNVSVLKTDAKDIDVNKIREMLDKKYRDNMPQRQSIDIDIETEIEEEAEVGAKEPTKEYDINEIIAQAKSTKEENYEEERLRKLRDTNYTILDNLNLKNKTDEDEDADDDEEVTSEKELRELINTITELEAKSKNKANEPDLADEDNDLLDLTDENDTALLPAVEDIESEEEASVPIENSFYTGNLSVNDKDFDDFNDIEDDIKSNSIIIKILVFIFIIIIFGVAVFLLNNFLNWGLF